jgi:hypothetical protein
MANIWKYLSNQFLIETEGNFLKALRLAMFTDSALAARLSDPFFNAQYAIFHPLYDTLNKAFDNWDTQKGTQKGKTTSVEEFLEQLSPVKINLWDSSVQAAGIAKGSANYVAIFPNGHKPFQRGETLTRINAINSLSQAIDLQIPPAAPPTHPLVLLKADVDINYTLASDILTTQQGEISDTGSISALVEQARVNAMIGLYAFLGICMNQFAPNPIVIEPLFDLETLRQIRQRLWQQTIAPVVTKLIFKRTLEPNDKIRLKVDSAMPLVFALVNEKNDPIGAISFTVEGFEEEIVLASQLGNIPADTYFKVQNTDGTVIGDFIIEIM